MSDRGERGSNVNLVAPSADRSDLEAAAINRLVHRVLRVGLIVSAALLVFGLILWFISRGPIPATTSMPAAALRQAAHLEPIGFFSLGLLVLILTPFMRVAGSVVVFLRERDWRYSAITAGVLAIMIVSLFVGSG